MNSGSQRTPPSGVVTFLFTDIEGSTRRWEADADGMRAALSAHDDLLREAIEAHDGWLFKHTGDGICAVFASPKAAVDAAVSAQRDLGLPVRMGIATGEAEFRADDYFGNVLNRVARLMAAGHGGQILLEGTTASLLNGVDTVELGSRRLRDIAKAVDIFQVSAPGLRTEFPPLRTLDTTPGNLRPTATSFIGRDAELAELQTALKAHRLLTLTGVGGVGKTRLARELASIEASAYPDGVWMIELATIGDPTAVPEAVAAVLGIVQQPGLSLADSIASALEGRSRLLIFDNCEHVLDAAADMIEAILAASSAVKVIATSREGLGLAAEQLWPVPSLDVRSSAATLFIERASAVAPAVPLDDDTAAIGEICRRLDGIPLAIELAASRMQSMTVTEVRDRLDDRFRLLVGSRRGLERHQTLRHAVQWSYDLLHADEKALLTRCSVFAGGFGLGGACAVNRTDDMTTLDLLDALVRKSLLVADRSAGRTRFAMLETIRRFAEARLVADGSAEETRTAHAQYFASREAEVLALWDSPRQREAYDWFSAELSNLRAAFRWAADSGDLDNAVAIAVYGSFLGTGVDQHEPYGWAEELVDPAVKIDHPRLAQLYAITTLCYYSGRLDDAANFARAAQAAVESGRYDEFPFELETAIGAFYAAIGQPDRWVDLCRDVIARRPKARMYARSAMVSALAIAGRTEEALAESEELLTAAETTDNPQRASFALFAYGIARRNTDPPVAYRALSRGLAIARESGNRQYESSIAVSLGWLAVKQVHPHDAFDHLALAIRTRYDAGSFRLMDSPLAILATQFVQLGLYEPAATVIGKAVTPMTQLAYLELNSAIAQLREVLGDEKFEQFSRVGAAMSNAAMATYALEQIALARADLATAGGSS